MKAKSILSIIVLTLIMFPTAGRADHSEQFQSRCAEDLAKYPGSTLDKRAFSSGICSWTDAHGIKHESDIFDLTKKIPESMKIVEYREVDGAMNWRLVQLQDGWAIFGMPESWWGHPSSKRRMLAVKGDGIPGRMTEGALLYFKLGLSAKLRRLPDIHTKTTRGFDVTVRRYEVLRQQREDKRK